MTTRAASLLLAVLCCGAARPAAAEERRDADRAHAPSPGSDGVYGRFDGSIDLALGAGVELEAGEPRAALHASGHFLSTAGVYSRYEDGFGSNDERPFRALAFGIDVRPLFLPRFALDLQQGPALLDLTLDSLSLNAGAYFAQPQQHSFGHERGFDLGLGFGVPLCGEARGLWLEARAERRFADRGEHAWLLTLGLAYHTLILSTDSRP
jgi:hypothetical protein